VAQVSSHEEFYNPFTVNIPCVTPPSASTITTIEMLSNSVLSGGTHDVSGTYTFKTPSSVLTAGTNQSVEVLFVPTNTTIYNSVTTTSTINVTAIPANATTVIQTKYNATPVQLTASSKPPSSGSVTYAPAGLSSVGLTNLPDTVTNTVIGVSPVLGGSLSPTVVLTVNAYNSSSTLIHDFSATPLTITITIPNFVSNSITVATYDTLGGTLIDTVIGNRVSIDSYVSYSAGISRTIVRSSTYSITLTHLTTLIVTSDTAINSIPCFPTGTRIKTLKGYVPVETLKRNDLVLTSDHRQVPVKIYSQIIAATTAATAPYLIPKGYRGLTADLCLSPLHAFQIKKGLWQIPMYAAKQTESVCQYDIGKPVTYYHLECPNFFTDNLIVDGCVVESYGANQVKGLKTLYKYNAMLKGFTRASQMAVLKK